MDWFGPTDFLRMDDQLAESGLGPCNHSDPDSPESILLGARITDIPERVRRASPITYAHRGIPPILIQHGRLDHVVPVQQSMILAERLAECVGPEGFEFDILEGADHADPLFDTEENLDRVLGFLDRHLK